MQNKGAAAVCERLRLDVRDGLMSPAPHALQVAALDSDGEDDGEYDDPEGEAWLPDDFIALANSDDPTASWGGEEDDDANGEMTEEDHWRSIGHGGPLRGWRPPMGDAASGDDDEDDDDDTVAAASDGAPDRAVGAGRSDDDFSDGFDGADSAATSRFTEYSMTSSILTRTDIQQRQDDHFEEMFAQVRGKRGVQRPGCTRTCGCTSASRRNVLGRVQPAPAVARWPHQRRPHAPRSFPNALVV